MIDADTLVELLQANRQAERHICYVEGEGSERRLSYAELHRRAYSILWHLQQLGARRGDKLIIFLNNNEAFIDAFWAALLGGVVPVPLAVGISDEHRWKLLRIARKLGAPFLYTDQRTLQRLRDFAGQSGEQELAERLTARSLLIDQLGTESHRGDPAQVAADDVAFIQFSSGSTSEPKGVVLTHRNILANARGASRAAMFSDQDVALSWMPLTHDMGLIGMFIMMFANQANIHLMPTELFVRRPLLWTSLAARKRATILASPNFGLRHFLKVLGERDMEPLDLGGVRLIFNGAEPINVALCDEFLARLATSGLKPETMLPVYGLAEASLAVTFPAPGHRYRSLLLDRHSLQVGSPVRAAEAGSRDAAQFICEGRAIPYCELRVVDEADLPLPEWHVGHIQIRGENVTGGYFEAADINRQTFTADGWLRTGDLGLIEGGELFVTGRAKEIIFVNGQNYYPHDLEAVAHGAAGLELGKVVAAGCRPPGAESDQLTLFVLHRGSLEEFLPLASEVARRVNEHTGLEVSQVVPVRRIPKTTSGKLQRVALEQAYLAGEFATELDQLALLQAAAAPAGPERGGSVEGRIMAIVEDLLPGKGIGADDNLFEIGVSSLMLIQLHEKLESEFPGLIDLTELFDFPTASELARQLQSRLSSQDASPPSPAAG